MKTATLLLTSSILTSGALAQTFNYGTASQEVSVSYLMSEGQNVHFSGADSDSLNTPTAWSGFAEQVVVSQSPSIVATYRAEVDTQFNVNTWSFSGGTTAVHSPLPGGWTASGEARVEIEFTFNTATGFDYTAQRTASGDVADLRISSLDGSTTFLLLDGAGPDNITVTLGAGDYRATFLSTATAGVNQFNVTLTASPTVPEPGSAAAVAALGLTGFWAVRRLRAARG